MTNAIWNDATLDERMRTENHNLWLQRYQAAPNMTPDGLKGSGDSFIVPGTEKENLDHLKRRKDECDGSMVSADKTRLNLLHNAEYCQVSPDASAMDKRQSLGLLMDYDHKHEHPISDSSRSFQAEPMTALEQSRWMQREGRQKTTEEHDWTRANEDRIQQDQRTVHERAENSQWHIHPQVAERRASFIAEHIDADKPTHSMGEQPSMRDKLAQRRGVSP